VAHLLPPLVQLEFDGRYAAMLSHEPKNYALLDYDGRLLLRGVAFRSSRAEPFGEAFLRRAIERIPPSRAFYQFWAPLDPGDPHWHAVEEAWRGELARWGGAEVFREHWRRLRSLRHQHVLANLLTDHDALYRLLAGRRDPAIWWSNAFFTFFSNWHHQLAERRRIYERWIDGLARRAPDLLLYGSDCNNVSVNCIRAGEYRQRFAEGDDLAPVKLYRHAMRF